MYETACFLFDQQVLLLIKHKDNQHGNVIFDIVYALTSKL